METIFTLVKMLLAALGVVGFLVLLVIGFVAVMLQRNPPEDW